MTAAQLAGQRLAGPRSGFLSELSGDLPAADIVWSPPAALQDWDTAGDRSPDFILKSSAEIPAATRLESVLKNVERVKLILFIKLNPAKFKFDTV